MFDVILYQPEIPMLGGGRASTLTGTILSAQQTKPCLWRSTAPHGRRAERRCRDTLPIRCSMSSSINRRFPRTAVAEPQPSRVQSSPPSSLSRAYGAPPHLTAVVQSAGAVIHCPSDVRCHPLSTGDSPEHRQYHPPLRQYRRPAPSRETAGLFSRR